MKKYEDDKIKFSVISPHQMYQVSGDPRFGLPSYNNQTDLSDKSKTTSFKSKAVAGVLSYDKLLK